MDKETLHRYFAGKSTSEEEVHIVDWVEQSEANRKIYLKERMIWDAVTVNCDPQNIPASTTIRSLHTNVWRTIAVAASIALLLGISWTVWDRSEDKILQQQTVIVPAGQRVQLRQAVLGVPVLDQPRREPAGPPEAHRSEHSREREPAPVR